MAAINSPVQSGLYKVEALSLVLQQSTTSIMAKDKNKELANLLFPTQDEQFTEESILSIPPEQRRLHTETYDFTISTIIDYLDDDKMFIPKFQRRYVWTPSQASRLIESLIIQCPIPVIYLNQEKDERLSVVDGNQRLTSFRKYLSDEFSLKGLTAYPELEGAFFSELDKRFQRHILNRTLRCIVISKDTHPQVKFDVFERLNSGSVKLTPQELRHGLYYGPFMTYIEDLSKAKEWRALTSTTGEKAGEKRMRGEELVLRFLALKFNLQNYQKPLAGFLNDFSEKYRQPNDTDKAEMSSAFYKTIKLANSIYGTYCFRAFTKDREFITPFNTALFDAEMVAASNFTDIISLPVTRQNHEKFLDALSILFEEEKFQKSISRATSDESQVRYRIQAVTNVIESCF